MPNDTIKVQNLCDSLCMTAPPGRYFPNHNACYKVNVCYMVIEADQLYYCSCCISIRLLYYYNSWLKQPVYVCLL